MKHEIKYPKAIARMVYDVEWQGKTYTFDSWAESTKFEHKIMVESTHKFMNELGIDERPIFQIVASKQKQTDRMGRKVWRCMLMFGHKLVANGDVVNGKIHWTNTTEWNAFESYCSNVRKLLSDLDGLRPTLLSQFNCRNGAFRSYWGNDDDGMTHFQYEIHFYQDGVRVINCDKENNANLIEL